MKRNRRKALTIVAILGLSFFMMRSVYAAQAKEPDYPTKPITFYIPWAAGGPLTDISRPLLEAASKHLGQPFAVINKPGGGATLGAMSVMNAKPDGYTLGLFTGIHIMTPYMEDAPYKDLNGYTILMKFMGFPQPLIVRSDGPFKGWREFIEWARKNPKGVKVAIPSSKSQSPQGLVMWQIEQKERVKFTYLVMPGSADSLSAILGGHINAEIESLGPTRLQYIKDGQLRIIAHVTSYCVPGYENISRIEDQYDIVAPPSFGAIWGPKGLPPYVTAKLDDAFAKAVKDPEFIVAMKRQSFPVAYSNAAQINKEIKEMFPRVGDIIRKVRAEEASEKK